jgi:predicted phosphodiesterase
MKIQLASDLHFEFLERRFPGERIISPEPDAELLVLAGDIHNDAMAVGMFENWPVPIVYLAGNHEYYGQQLEKVRADLTPIHIGPSFDIFQDEVG